MKKNILKTQNKKFKKCFCTGKRGFTLVELLLVIAIIGILAGVVTVNISGSVAKSKRASALTSAASVLPELVTCEDDGGIVSAPSPTDIICCDDTAGCPTAESGHGTATWPDIEAKTGWAYATPDSATPNANISSMTYTLTKGIEEAIVCSVASSSCD